ncbi:MAG: FmdB family zinc ribbon protein [Anaerolineae bacterium]
MPIYEYRCRKCHRRIAILLRSFSDIETARPKCTYCGHDELDRIVSRVSVLKSEEARLEALADNAALGDLDENDPRSIARWMKKMSAEAGEDLGDEFHEIVDRLESGQSPEEIEAAMPELGPGSASEMAGLGGVEDEL